jgi:hypothetical protein
MANELATYSDSNRTEVFQLEEHLPDLYWPRTRSDWAMQF